MSSVASSKNDSGMLLPKVKNLLKRGGSKTANKGDHIKIYAYESQGQDGNFKSISFRKGNSVVSAQ